MGFYLGIVAVLLVFAALVAVIARREGSSRRRHRTLTDSLSTGSEGDRRSSTNLHRARVHQNNHNLRSWTAGR